MGWSLLGIGFLSGKRCSPVVFLGLRKTNLLLRKATVFFSKPHLGIPVSMTVNRLREGTPCKRTLRLCTPLFLARAGSKEDQAREAGAATEIYGVFTHAWLPKQLS